MKQLSAMIFGNDYEDNDPHKDNETHKQILNYVKEQELEQIRNEFRAQIYIHNNEQQEEIEFDDDKLEQILGFFKSKYVIDKKFYHILQKYEEQKQQHDQQHNFFIYVDFQDSIDKFKQIKERQNYFSITHYLELLYYAISSTCLRITRTSFFESLTLAVILFNSLILAFDTDVSNETESERYLEDCCFYFYCCETLIKILAYGFYFNKDAYLRSNWNRLDFSIVFIAVLDRFTELKNLSIIRNFRILKPLRSIVKFQSLRSILEVIMKSLVLLLDTIIIIIFYLILLALVMGFLSSQNVNQRCVEITTVIQIKLGNMSQFIRRHK